MENHPDRETIHRELKTNAENPATQIADAVADIEGKETTDLAAMYRCVDGVLDNLFSTPPDAEAQMEVSFNYESYRITIEQDVQPNSQRPSNRSGLARPQRRSPPDSSP